FLGGKLDRLGGDSVAYFKRVQQAHVNSAIANGALAQTLLVKGYSAESLRYFQAAIALRPTDAVLHHNFGKALLDLGKGDEALVEFEEAKRLGPESALFYDVSIGQALTGMNRLAEAERLFRRVLETRPADAYCLSGLGHCLFNQGRHAAA